VMMMNFMVGYEEKKGLWDEEDADEQFNEE
jgi:hypothetical protein